MSRPVVYIYAPYGGFLSLPANPLYDPRRERQERFRDMEAPRDLPTDYVHFCDVCEKGFNTEQQYRSHLNKHVWCDVPGCKFTCLKDKEWKMEMHKTTLHDRDDAPDLANIDNYIASRKKKFPTAEKILTKAEEFQLLVARGGILTREQWRWLKVQENARIAEAEAAEGNRAPRSPQSPPMALHGEVTAEAKGSESESADENPSSRHIEVDRDQESDETASGDEFEQANRAENTPEEKQNLPHENSTPRPIQTHHLAARTKSLRGNSMRRQRKRNLSLFEKLTVEDRLVEKGQVLQALRYFVATNFLKRVPKW